MKTYVPIHEDKALTLEWLEQRGFVFGKNVFYNAIRDNSGRYDGFVLLGGKYPITVKSIDEALRTQNDS